MNQKKFKSGLEDIKKEEEKAKKEIEKALAEKYLITNKNI